MNNFKYIYALIDPRNNLIKYIGASKNPKKRYVDHISDEKRGLNTKKTRWIKDLKNINLKPILTIIEIVFNNEWEKEEQFWINYYGIDNLTNDTIGGIGNKIPSKESIGKTSKKLTGKKHSEERTKKFAMSRMGVTLCQGIKMGKTSKSKYVGVYKSRKYTWGSQIYYKNKKYYLGSYKSEEEVAEMYNKKAIELYGNKARLNIIERNY